MFIPYTLILFALFCYFLYYYFTKTFDYWKSRKIPGPPPLPIFGNLKDVVFRKQNTGTIYKEFYDEYPDEKVVGIYRMTTPCLLLRDLDIIKNILIKDFNYFTDRGIEFSKKGLGANLFHADEEIWRHLRSRFSPLFTSGKLKHMVYLLVERSDIFITYVKTLTDIQPEQNVYSIIQKYTMSSISSCAFGLDVDIENKKFMTTIDKIDKLIFTRNLMQEFDLMYPGALKSLNLSIFPTEIVFFFKDLVDKVLKARDYKPTNRQDFMDLILELRQQSDISLNKKTEIGDEELFEMTDDIITAQAFVFFAAGYETTATTMLYMVYELAKNPDIQEKIIAEIDETLKKHNGEVTYETVCDLHYMEKAFDETLRKYPIVEPLQRVAKFDYTIPGTNVTVKKGQIVVLSVLGIQWDEKYYPNPEKFDPQRFSSENVMNRHSCAYIPFGQGPRNCIGMRFAKLQSRIGLLKLFSKFRVTPSKNTPESMIFNPMRITLSPQSNLLLNLIPRDDIK